MITLHHLNNSRSQRILWLLEELGLEYEVKFYQRDRKTLMAPKELRKIHPLGKSPVITDGTNTVAESGAIVEYLISKYGKGRLKPKDGTPEQLKYTYFLHYAEGSLMMPLILLLVFSRISKPPSPVIARPILKLIAAQVRKTFINSQVKLHFDFIESTLGQHEWFSGGEFTAADIQMSYPIEAAAARIDYSDRPHLQKYLDRIQKRPAYIRALARGGDQSQVF